MSISRIGLNGLLYADTKPAPRFRPAKNHGYLFPLNRPLTAGRFDEKQSAESWEKAGCRCNCPPACLCGVVLLGFLAVMNFALWHCFTVPCGKDSANL
jgi:hypothetical protein